jgi:hypothetical protein
MQEEFLEHEEEREDMEMGGEEEEEEQIFSCRLDNTKLLVELLVSLSVETAKDMDCFIEATPEGSLLLENRFHAFLTSFYLSAVVFCNWTWKEYSSNLLQ